MKIEHKIVEALRELLRCAVDEYSMDYADYTQGGIVEGLQKAYDKASIIADGFE